jgi:hypothetical protein
LTDEEDELVMTIERVEKLKRQMRPKPGDLVLIIRDGTPILQSPVNTDGPVPEDFLILIGVASSWIDPRFRGLMLRLMHAAEEAGHLDSIMHREHLN